jgi:hypothetical protein
MFTANKYCYFNPFTGLWSTLNLYNFVLQGESNMHYSHHISFSYSFMNRKQINMLITITSFRTPGTKSNY